MAIPSGYSLLGRIGYNDRGVYTESSDYVRGDVVYHEGSSYVALTTVTGVTPADDNTNWKYLARGFGATELSEIDATDTSGFAGDAGKKVKGQTLIDKIAEYVMSKVVATDAFQTYLQKFLVDNCVTERSDLSLSAAQGKALQDQLATLNRNLFPNNGRIPDGTDFNSLITVGKYFVVSDDRTLTMTNIPEQVSGRLFVLNMLGDEKVLNKEYQYFIQIYLLRTGTLWMRTLRRENDGSPIIFDNWVKRW